MDTSPQVATWRSILIGLFLLTFNVYWVTVTEMKYRAEATALPIFIYPVFILFCLVVFNYLLSKFWPSKRLVSSELLTIYAMLVVSTSIASYGMLQDFFALIVHPYWFATEENEWKELFFHYVPSWFTANPTEAVLTGYYQGNSSFYQVKHLTAWLKPTLIWTVFTLVLLFMLHCLNILVRRQWVHTERLAFPIIQLPIAMVQSPNFLRHRLLWLGFAIPAVLDLINGLHVLFPAVPYLHLKLHFVGRQLVEKPWSAMSDTRISFYPFMIGLGFFLPIDLSFTCWFFFVIRQLTRVLSSYLGVTHLPGFPYFYEQSAGAWLCMCFIAVWLTRRHLVSVVQTAISRKSSIDADEPMRYRTAIAGFVGGFLFMSIFSYRAGMTLTAILTFFALYFVIAVAVTRLRAEFGAPHGIFNHPADMMVTAFGTSVWGGHNLTVMSFYHWFNRSYRSHAMPNQFEPLKMAEVVGFNTRRLVIAMMIGSLVALIVGMWTNLDMMYRDGALAQVSFFKIWVADTAFNRLENWLFHPTPPDTLRTVFMGLGILLTLILHILRTRFYWWPLHPAGYPLAVSFAIDYFWFTFFISWVLKTIILKSRGVKGYQRTILFFFGLILGDFVVGALWMVFGALTQQQVYMIYLNGGTWY
ncbi:MAG: DUF6785 family protein [Candidatus Poribacteria bacterium]